MYVVKKRFFDKTNNNKFYQQEDTYIHKDKARLKMLVENGFIEKKEEEKNEQKTL